MGEEGRQYVSLMSKAAYFYERALIFQKHNANDTAVQSLKEAFSSATSAYSMMIHHQDASFERLVQALQLAMACEVVICHLTRDPVRDQLLDELLDLLGGDLNGTCRSKGRDVYTDDQLFEIKNRFIQARHSDLAEGTFLLNMRF